jgi:hypothetical protein
MLQKQRRPSASFNNGVLTINNGVMTITLPKTSAAKGTGVACRGPTPGGLVETTVLGRHGGFP